MASWKYELRQDGFPLLFNTFNTKQARGVMESSCEEVPLLGGPDSTEHLMPHLGPDFEATLSFLALRFTLYTALLWFPSMALGDTVSRRVPQFLDITQLVGSVGMILTSFMHDTRRIQLLAEQQAVWT